MVIILSFLRLHPSPAFQTLLLTLQFISVQFSHSVVSNSLQPHGLLHARLPCPPPTPEACSNSCPSSQWCLPTISSSVIPFSSCLGSFPAWRYFPTTQFFVSGGQSIGASTSASVLPMNVQDWFPLGLTAWISLLSKGLPRVFSSTIVWKHQFFGAQLFLIVQLYVVIVNHWYVQLYNTWLAFGKQLLLLITKIKTC